MAKRFSIREMALLTAPILAIGAVTLVVSRRPTPEVSLPGGLGAAQVPLDFSIQTPSALEAFGGANTVFVVDCRGARVNDFTLNPALIFKTRQGSEIINQYQTNRLIWSKKLWVSSASKDDKIRYLLNTTALPAGDLRFICSGLKMPPPSVGSAAPITPTAPIPFTRSWRVDRSKIKAPNLAALPRKPFVSVREVKILSIEMLRGGKSVPFLGRNLAGQVIFNLNGAAMDEKTSFETSFSEHHKSPPNTTTFGISYGSGNAAPAMPRRRVISWTVMSNSPTQKLNVSGRASADNRWPLGFQIEPFNFKTAKVGQKLKFKQFPVALPKP